MRLLYLFSSPVVRTQGGTQGFGREGRGVKVIFKG